MCACFGFRAASRRTASYALLWSSKSRVCKRVDLFFFFFREGECNVIEKFTQEGDQPVTLLEGRERRVRKKRDLDAEFQEMQFQRRPANRRGRKKKVVTKGGKAAQSGKGKAGTKQKVQTTFRQIYVRDLVIRCPRVF